MNKVFHAQFPGIIVPLAIVLLPNYAYESPGLIDSKLGSMLRSSLSVDPNADPPWLREMVSRGPEQAVLMNKRKLEK